MSALANLADKMDEIYADGMYDNEGAHITGDDILIEALLQVVRNGSVTQDDKDAIFRLVSVWNSMEKWYA